MTRKPTVADVRHIEKANLRALLHGYPQYAGLFAVAAKHLPGFYRREHQGAVALLRAERMYRENRRTARDVNPPVWLVFTRDAWRRAQAVYREAIVRVVGKSGAQLLEPEEGDVAQVVIGPVPRDSIAADLLRTELSRAAIRPTERYEPIGELR